MTNGISLKLGLLGAAVVVAIYNSRVRNGIEVFEHALYIFSLLAIITFCIVTMLRKSEPENPATGRIPRGVKVSVASLGVAWGIFFLLSVLLIPIFGYTVVDLMVGPWSLPILVLGAILVLPYVERRLQ